ncbi:hypothetical protein JHK87_026084 [Glycine soja]|nr:hypothetical protein JHK87_026084 [Glycine soja]
MIGWEEVYKVVVAVVPLYFALLLGYGSLKWWNIFTREQCEAINKLVCYFTLPLFIFEFTAHIDPFKMNYSFIAADTISKFIIMVVLALWAKCTPKGTFSWSITSFSLCNLTNALVVGVPMVKPMYGALGVDLVVQASVIQATIWFPLLLFVLEFWRTGSEGTTITTTTTLKPRPKTMIIDNESGGGKDVEATTVAIDVKEEMMLEESVTSSTFMALQEKVIACGPSMTIIGLVLKFIAGPAATAIGAIVVGLRGDVLRVVIIQAAVPQSITSFIFAKEYGLHPEVLSTA